MDHPDFTVCSFKENLIGLKRGLSPCYLINFDFFFLRNGTPPFMCARTVLEPLLNSVEVKSEKPDLLELCHLVAMEVVNLGTVQS